MTEIVGILNLTPDSFSGDGLHDKKKAIRQFDRMIEDGADIVDIGAESTRPGAVLLSPKEEWQRFEVFIDDLVDRKNRIRFSIDTRHYETAYNFIKRFTKKYASSIFINDVSGGSNEKLVELAKNYGATLIVTHSLTIPADPEVTIPESVDVVETVYKWGRERIEKLGENIVLDPGIGFGKTSLQSLDIIKNIARLKSLGARIMVGHSRKSFLKLFTDKKAGERDAETLLISDYLAGQGVDFLRVHDVRSHCAMLKIRSELCEAQ